MSENSIITITGCSGSGKTSVAKKLSERHSDKLHLYTSYASRKPREGEVNGIDYWFIDPELFIHFVNSGFFMEYTMYDGHRGAAYCDVLKIMDQGKAVLIVVDLHGVRQIEEFCTNPDSKISLTSIFLKPPSVKEAIKRMKSRGDDKVLIDYRAELLESEMILDKEFDFDFTIVNDNLNKCVEEIEDSIEWLES